MEPSYHPEFPLATADSTTYPFGDFVRSEMCCASSAICPLHATIPSITDDARSDPFRHCLIHQIAPEGQPSPLPPPAVFDPDFPAPEPKGLSFALPFTDSFGRTYARLAEPNKLLDMYSAPTALAEHLSSSPVAMHHLPQWLCSCLPFATADAMVESIVGTLFHYLDHTDTTRQSTATVLIQHATRTTTPMDWVTAYINDSETKFILQHLRL
jgi:hypothetical protein